MQQRIEEANHSHAKRSTNSCLWIGAFNFVVVELSEESDFSYGELIFYLSLKNIDSNLFLISR